MTVIRSDGPATEFAVVFEDDGETGYFYALRGTEVLDALHVYDVNSAGKESVALEIVWTNDGQCACLVLDRVPQAIVDFARSRAACRTNFPPPDRRFCLSHVWDDGLLEPFF